MIKFENSEVWGFQHALRGMRNPLNSWDKADTIYDLEGGVFKLGEADVQLMQRLIKSGPEHRKFLRQVFVSVDITAPLYWWKEFDTYKVGTVADSCSTMHTIHKRALELDDFSHDKMNATAIVALERTIKVINIAREAYLCYGDKECWYSMVQLLPSSYNQRRTVTMNYEVLLNILKQRQNHKLDEWKEFCKWIRILPHMEAILPAVESRKE